MINLLLSDQGKCTKYCTSLRTESREKHKYNQEQRLRLEEIGGLRHFYGAKFSSLLSQNQSLKVFFKTAFESWLWGRGKTAWIKRGDSKTQKIVLLLPITSYMGYRVYLILTLLAWVHNSISLLCSGQLSGLLVNTVVHRDSPMSN